MLKNSRLTFNQITLITDGYSNQGISPIEAAKKALQQNIAVNVIGITNRNSIGLQGQKEIEAIASEGGGLYQIVPIEHIAKTVQMVTKKAVNKTIQQVVHTQLSEILGKEELQEIPPKERLKVARMMDDMSEYSSLNILLLVDLSASMLPKLDKVKEAIVDFQLSLQARSGESKLSVLSFPGDVNHVDIKIPWTNQIRNVEALVYKLKPRGNTPTGPALLSSIFYFSNLNKREPVPRKKGVLDEYIV